MSKLYAMARQRRRVDLGFGHTYVWDYRKVPYGPAKFLVVKDENGRKTRYWDYVGRGQFAYKGEHV